MIRLLIPVMALAAFFAYQLWGLAGTAALLAGYALLGAVSWWRVQRGERAMLARLEGMSDAQIRDALPQLDPADRAEVERALQRIGRLSADRLDAGS